MLCYVGGANLMINVLIRAIQGQNLGVTQYYLRIMVVDLINMLTSGSVVSSPESDNPKDEVCKLPLSPIHVN